jgi:hypothetical protein
LLFLTLLATLFVQCRENYKESEPVAITAENPNYYFSIFQNPDASFGYDIFGSDSVKMIHQAVIPAVQGNRGFKTSDLAQEVAIKVIEKLERGETPPTLSQEEVLQIIEP